MITLFASNDRVTTDPAATTQPGPNRTPARMIDPAPSQQSLPIEIGWSLDPLGAYRGAGVIEMMILTVKRDTLTHQNVIPDRYSTGASDEGVVTNRRIVSDRQAVSEMPKDAGAFDQRELAHGDSLAEEDPVARQASQSATVLQHRPRLDREMAPVTDATSGFDESDPATADPDQLDLRTGQSHGSGPDLAQQILQGERRIEGVGLILPRPPDHPLDQAAEHVSARSRARCRVRRVSDRRRSRMQIGRNEPWQARTIPGPGAAQCERKPMSGCSAETSGMRERISGEKP